MPKIITPHLEEILLSHQDGPPSSVQTPLKLDKALVRKLLSSEGTITYKKAEELTNEINTSLDQDKKIEDYLIISSLKGKEKDRDVIVEYADKETSKDDWISIVHYVFTKKFKGMAHRDIYWLLLILGLILICTLYYFSH